jgi:thiol-disulfide isomerase/thioredoxin
LLYLRGLPAKDVFVARSLFINILVAIAAAAAGFALYRFAVQPRLESAAAPEMSAVPAQSPAPPPIDPVDTLPDFTLSSRSGELVSIRSWPGKSLIVNFWATWCAPCRKEIPLLIKTHKAHSSDGFVVVGIAVDEREKVLQYADEIELDYPLLIGEQEGLDALAAFGVATPVFPVTAFTDNQGRLVAVYPGELTPEKLSVFLDAVSRVNSGDQSPSQARTAIAQALDKLHPEHSSEETADEPAAS